MKLELPVRKNDVIEIEVTGINHDGAGVGHVNGYTLFIRQALPGERVQVRVEKTNKKYGFAKLLEVLQPGPHRVVPKCELYPKCGGCQLQHADYEGQLQLKHQRVIDTMQRVGKLNDVQIHPPIGMDNPWYYRNKAQVPVGEAKDPEANNESRIIAGFYAAGSHRIVDMESCYIQQSGHVKVVKVIKTIAAQLGISAYDEESGRGELRHIVVRSSFHNGDMMVTLVTRSRKLKHQEQWIRHIREQLPEVVSICHNHNAQRTNVIFGDTTRVVWGKEFITDQIGGIEFAISARSFYQVNPVQTEVLYRKALEYAALTGEETVIDAYCGIGTISLFLARQAREVFGVEMVPEAIDDAKRNAELNGIQNVHFEVGRAEEVIPAWKQQGVVADVIVVDPPRKGCDPALIETMIAMQPQRIVYVSCNPATLARDLQLLEQSGNQTQEIQPVDMFPHTVHVECVALLVRDGTDGGKP